MENKIFPYRRILIVGCGGAGKSTLASQIGLRFDLPIVNLDKLWWLPNWQTRSEDEFDALLQSELCKPTWIIEGNFFRTFSHRLAYADLCIFLDYPTNLCLKSVYERAEKFKGCSRPDMTEGCIEHVDPEFEQWIRSFQKEIKPKMLAALASANTPYKIFYLREQTQDWLNAFQNS